MRFEPFLIRYSAVAVLLFTLNGVFAQEPAYMGAATHPGRGQFYSRMLLSYRAGRSDGKALAFKLAYGVNPRLALLLDVDARSGTQNAEDDAGLYLTSFQLKQRILQVDLGPLNTWRTSVRLGLAIPGDVRMQREEDVIPSAGLVSTAILGRHGLNAEAEWHGYAEVENAWLLNGSYLYRLAPAEYSIETRGAWYTMTELLHEMEDGGASRTDIALGLLYEASRWAAEVSLLQPLDNGPESYDYEITAGFRWLH